MSPYEENFSLYKYYFANPNGDNVWTSSESAIQISGRSNGQRVRDPNFTGTSLNVCEKKKGFWEWKKEEWIWKEERK